jgi:hypothetical protein
LWDSLSFPRLGNARHDKARLRAAWHGNETRIAWQIVNGRRFEGSADRSASDRNCDPIVIVSPSPLFEIARVFVRLGHVARFVVNANHGVI